MRRADEEPEAPGPAEAGPARRRIGGRLVVPLVVAGAAAVVLSTAAEGRARFTPFGSGASQQAVGPSQPPAAQPTLPPPDAPAAAVGSIIETVLVVLACAIALVVAVVLVRLLVAALRNRRRRARRQGLRAVEVDAAPEVADAPAVLRGIAAALVAFDERREASDAVVRAWLGLQEAAEVAGFARSPAETPTEFTGRVLTRSGADRVALQRLLRLYLRARFDDGVITADEAAAARHALRALESSWERAEGVPQP